MSGIIAFLITPLGRWAAISGMIFMTWFAFARHYEHKGAERVAAKIEQGVAANAKKANEARHSVQSVPADKLHDIYTRD